MTGLPAPPERTELSTNNDTDTIDQFINTFSRKRIWSPSPSWFAIAVYRPLSLFAMIICETTWWLKTRAGLAAKILLTKREVTANEGIATHVIIRILVSCWCPLKFESAPCFPGSFPVHHNFLHSLAAALAWNLINTICSSAEVHIIQRDRREALPRTQLQADEGVNQANALRIKLSMVSTVLDLTSQAPC